MQGLTERQYKAYIWTKKFITKNGWSPSVEQIGDALGITAGSAGELINRVIERGYLCRVEGKQRSLYLPDGDK
jgi:SOS-response transcriptional repressor LexA